MKIATWNLQSDWPLRANRREAFLAAMDAINADVWVLTETWLSFSPGEVYHYVAHSCEAPDLGSNQDRRWVSIWSRIPARVLEVQSDPERMACIHIEQPDWPDLVIVGTVLPWHGNGGDAAFRDALDAQVPDWGRLWMIPPSCVFCVAGDFNQPMQGCQMGFSHARCAALAEAFTRSRVACVTGHLPAQDGHGDRTIDHICIGGIKPPLIALPAETWAAPWLDGYKMPISNHDGYSVDLRFTH